MSVDFNTGVTQGKDALMNPQEISIDDIGQFLGKDPVVHLGSGYNEKNIPEYFNYKAITLEELKGKLAGLNTQPQIFTNSRSAAQFMRDNSMFVTDTYVLNPPGTQMYLVYQLGNFDTFKISSYNHYPEHHL